MKRRERPIKRVNPSGKERWVARYTNGQGMHKSAGTFDRKGPCARREDRTRFGKRRVVCCAQHAIDAAYDDEARGTGETLGEYAKTWPDRHPRSERTNKVNADRVRYVRDLEVDGCPLRDWPYRDLRRKHALELVGLMLTEQGRSIGGARGIIRTLSAMTEDAITDELADVNAFKGVRVRKSDPRATKAPRKPRVFTFGEMHEFARHARAIRPLVPDPENPGEKRLRPKSPPRNCEAMIRTVSDCDLRLGELLGLARGDYQPDPQDPRQQVISVRGNSHNGVFTEGDTDTKKHVRVVPVPPTCAVVLDAHLEALDARGYDGPLLFPTPTGKMWWERNFRRDVWDPAVHLSGMECAPHDFRHSYITNLRAAGVDRADLAVISAHGEAVADAVYTHSLGRSNDVIRAAIG